MSILSGGAYQGGAVRLYDEMLPRPGMVGTQRTDQITSPYPGVDNFNQWIRLVDCPLGLDRLVLQTRIHYKDYVDLGTRSGKSAEVNGRNTAFLGTWGLERIHYWRTLIPPDFKFIDGASTNTIIAQVHEVGTNSPAGQPPDFYVQINERNINFRQSNDTYPTTRTIYSMPVYAGMEFDFSLRCRWRDGIHWTPWTDGYLELIVNGEVCWRDTQTVNCWADVGDDMQPFPVAGVYKPNNPSEPTWTNSFVTMYHVGRATGDEKETHQSLAAFVASQL